MSTRRPTQPFSPLSSNIVGAPHSFLTHGLPAMDKQVEAELPAPEDTVSLTSLENDADEFDRLMIQTARDQRRLNDVRQGKVQAFRKARTHPRIGVTLENLERHNARNNAPLEPNAHVKFESPPSSSGSTRSDPALRPPSGWGRKARVKRNWMRTITADESQESGARDDTVDRFAADEEQTPSRADDADEPRQSIEDSPLSHKSSLHGTPISARRRSIEDWDFDMNEASLIASTPYPLRNTTLDDIRQREIESLKEQAVTTSRLGQIREISPEETRRPHSASARSTVNQPDSTAQEQASSKGSLSELRLRKRKNSWQAIGKSQAVTGEGTENTPIIVYKKSSETVGVVNSQILANGQADSKRPVHRREDSQDLLRRLARASNTPSPGRAETSRPHSAPAIQVGTPSQTMVTGTSSVGSKQPAGSMDLTQESNPLKANVPTTLRTYTSEVPELVANPNSSDENQTTDVDAKSNPVDQSILNPKTPVVTGAWVDTILDISGPSTAPRPTESSRSSTSPLKRDPRNKSTQDSHAKTSGEEQQSVASEVFKPNLPRSALEAIVEEARSSERRRPSDYGDSTINSLEELIAPLSDTSASGEPDEDTLLGIQMPTEKPRTEAERRRQQEALHLHKMNERLRAARTSLRDTNRGIRRVEDRIEQGGENIDDRERVRVVYRECPCASDGGHQLSFWNSFKTLFYDARLKPKRRGWGLTLLSIALISFFTWFILENIACEIWGHYEYASSYKGYGVIWGAPEYPYVLPTMTYRAFIKPWWRHVWAFLVWTWKTFGLGTEDVGTTARTTATRLAERILVRDQARVTLEEDAASVLGMAADEVVR
ncbi:hypothetical protein N0V90_000908 [Kalmusia sp. IMI 367209]|nr:hypothetical protein N0V90_000908 [Kalmusia sp. IMI 367209]